MTTMKEITVDSFAGGGGASLGMTRANGKAPDVAINHDPAAILMHTANHPKTKHYTKDVWRLHPEEVTKGRPVGLYWASPDCCHFSRAKGGKPVKKQIRSLAWVVVKWAAQVSPRVIILENVREFEDWGPLIQQVKDGVPQALEDGSPVLVPDPTRKGHSFRRWVGRLKALGYAVQWRVLNAADYGAPTHRRRLFLIARNDGKAIVWPEPTHGDPKKLGDTPLFGRPLPWRTAAECIDWSIPCPSIFDRKKPLADNTLRRIAMGIKRYVLDNPKPFIVQVNHGGPEFRGQDVGEPLSTVTGKHGYGVVTPVVTRIGQTNGNGKYNQPVDEALGTITSKAEHLLVSPKLTPFVMTNTTGHPGAKADGPLPTQTTGNHQYLVSPTLIQTGYGERPGQAPRVPGLGKPLGTCVDGQKHGLVSAFLSKYHGQKANESRCRPPDEPVNTLDTENRFGLVSAFLAKHFGGAVGTALDGPSSTATAKDHQSLVAANLVRFNHDDAGIPVDAPTPTVTTNNHAALVYSFLTKYFGTAIGQHVTEPMPTATGKDRFGLVTVMVEGEPYVIVDIGMRMLSPRELARAQGFPDSYVLTGSKSSQVARIGNSVCPVMAEVLAGANYKPATAKQRKAAV